MKRENIVCSTCNRECREMTDSNPTWFGKYVLDKLVEVICVDCHKKGVKFKKMEEVER